MISRLREGGVEHWQQCVLFLTLDGCFEKRRSSVIGGAAALRHHMTDLQLCGCCRVVRFWPERLCEHSEERIPTAARCQLSQLSVVYLLLRWRTALHQQLCNTPPDSEVWHTVTSKHSVLQSHVTQTGDLGSPGLWEGWPTVETWTTVSVSDREGDRKWRLGWAPNTPVFSGRHGYVTAAAHTSWWQKNSVRRRETVEIWKIKMSHWMSEQEHRIR